MKLLPVIESCDNCGACCMATPVPPFEPGEEIAKRVPPELLNRVHERIERGQQFDRLPCVWFDSTSKRCQHYDLRPDACRDFEINGQLCRISRADIGLRC